MDQFLDSGRCKIRVFMVWNSPPWTYGVRHQRGLESLLHHHWDACVVVFSETMELDFFEDLVKDGYGGIYLDSDIIVLNSLHSLGNFVSVENYTSGSSFFNGAVMAFERNRFNVPVQLQYCNYSSSDLHFAQNQTRWIKNM
ncbi:hypothetical protein C4D60_Mb09t17820 [Musa balbisiana]|uniref:Alpha 1,4-glycosyltransferase domain-containing protein n=1 Tax=Musa balbisiana TaxID=52838 RepID=A0A4S8IH62_MUSBA|nr:hypothetical protein C4D60_Mb09t17820 [Musa balbisiana]